MARVRSRTRLLTAAAVLLFVVAGACGKSNPVNPTPVCSYTLSSQTQSFASGGGQGSVNIATDAQCAWTVEGAGGWVTLLSAASGTGAGAVNFTVLPNAEGAAREKRLTIATVAFTITQGGKAACAYEVSPEQVSVAKDGGERQVTVTTDGDCSWIAKSGAPWITIASGAAGQGSGTVRLTIAENNATAARTGTVTVAGREVTVTQSAEDAPTVDCRYSVVPVSFEPCMPGGLLTARVSTQTSCRWTAATNTSWLTVSEGQQGNGPGTITIRYTDNYDAPRQGVVMVRWPTPTAGENIHVEQAGCTYAVDPATVAVPAAGGAASFNVFQESDPNTCGGALQDRCVWSAKSNVSWITISSGMPQSGDQRVNISVAANGGTSSRSGTITVRDKVVTVTQPAP